MHRVDDIDHQQQDPNDYYRNLHHYSPLCYTGRGPPLLMTHHNWLVPLPCLLVADALFILFIIVAWQSAHQEDRSMPAILINIITCTLFNLAFFSTILLNPGIVAQHHCEPEELTRFCERCNRKTTKHMKHCKECQVCVTDIDHHCAFFGKCIAGRQRIAFYAFLLLTVVSTVVLIGSLGSLKT